jgi:1-acyl-sn-glycerol-3-phosphate acyltransferase
MGGIFFLLLFLGISFSLFIFSAKKIYPAVHVSTRVLLFIMGLRLKVSGYRNFDPKCAYLIIGNHESLFDVFAIPAALPMHAVGIEAAYHFSMPFWGYLTRKWGNLPIERRNLTQAISTLKNAAKLLRSGTSIIVLPEGHRTVNGKIGKFKKGPFHLALTARADILPFALTGLFQYRSKNGWHLNPQTARVIFGKPIPYDAYQHCSVVELQTKVREIIIRLKHAA